MTETILQLLTAIFLIWVGFALRGWAESRKEDRSIRSHFDALGMEIRRCGQLAATYLDDQIDSPLYRLPCDAYRRALPVLFGAGLVTGDRADTLQKFYLQAEQVNRGLDNVENFLHGKIPDNVDQRITSRDEIGRLQLKAGEMRAQGHGEAASELYRQVVSAFEAIFYAWNNRSWWRRFRRKWIRPMRERLRKSWPMRRKTDRNT